MCGIAGYWTDTESDIETVGRRMADALSHRGPDDSGLWIDKGQGIVLGHRRLSILDLTETGRQPMHSDCGRYVLVFNGEIYNYRAIRNELNGAYNYRGTSDTEVLLSAIVRWGIYEALHRANGMFALALWDKTQGKLFLARDRAGEKPLYYGWTDQRFVFSSELKSILLTEKQLPRIDLESLDWYFRLGYIPAPHSIFENIRKVQPGFCLEIASPRKQDQLSRCYWSPEDLMRKCASNPINDSSHNIIDALDDSLRRAVKLRMEADVSLGAFLSGGIDSSTIVALMQSQSKRPVRTFTIGFMEPAYDEAAKAKAVARHLGTDHVEHYVTAKEARSVIPNIPWSYDEPFSDASQIPTFLVSILARGSVKVALSGDAGDELFGGYNRYRWAILLREITSAIPGGLRNLLARLMTGIPTAAWNKIGAKFGRQGQFGDQIHKLGDVLSKVDSQNIFPTIAQVWRSRSVVVGREHLPEILRFPHRAPEGLGYRQKLMYLDFLTYLQDDILTKVDRASMSVGLEARVPFLDPEVIEFAWRLPMHLKVRRTRTKWVLRQVLYKYVPRHLVEHPKMGFGVPIDGWLRGALREWAESLLSESALNKHGILDTKVIRQKWVEHLAGRRNWQYQLWAVLMFQQWFQKWCTAQ